MRQPAFTIYTRLGLCRCFTELDLLINLTFAIREGWEVVRVARERT